MDPRPWANNLNALNNYDWGAKNQALERELFFKGQEMQRQKLVDMLSQFESQAKVNPEGAIQRLMNPADPITQYVGQVKPQQQYIFGGKEYEISQQGEVSPYNQYKPLVSELQKVGGILNAKQLFEKSKAEFEAKRKTEVEKQRSVNQGIADVTTIPARFATTPLTDIDAIGGNGQPEMLARATEIKTPISLEALAQMDIETANKFEPETAKQLETISQTIQQAEGAYSPEQMDYYAGLLQAYPNIRKMSPKQVEAVVTAYDKSRLENKPTVSSIGGEQFIKVVDDKGNVKWQQVKDGADITSMSEFAGTQGIARNAIESQLQQNPELARKYAAFLDKKHSSQKVSINIGKEDDEYKKARGKQIATRVEEAQNWAKAASNKLATYSAIEKLIPNVYTGTGAGAVQAIQKLGASLGLKISGVSSLEAMQSLASSLIAQNKQLLPGPMSDADRQFLISMEANPTMTREGISRVVSIAKKQAENANKLVGKINEAQRNNAPAYDIDNIITDFYSSINDNSGFTSSIPK